MASSTNALVSPVGHVGPLALAPAQLRTLCTLLDWQLWYWGQDIHHLGGNALAAYGFRRVPGPPDGTQRSTAYELTALAGRGPSLHGLTELIAWGFGVSATHADHRQEGALMLVRHERSPGLCVAPVHARAGTRESLPARVYPHTGSQWACLNATLSAVARCLEDYEHWARQALGEAHRLEAQHRRPRAVRRRHAHPPFLASAWRAFVERDVHQVNTETMPTLQAVS